VKEANKGDDVGLRKGDMVFGGMGEDLSGKWCPHGELKDALGLKGASQLKNGGGRRVGSGPDKGNGP